MYTNLNWQQHYKYIDIPHSIVDNFVDCKWTLENTEGEIKKGQSRETGDIGDTRRRKTRHNTIMCWTPPQANNHKQHKQDMLPPANNWR